MMPTKRFVQESVTKAELGMEKANDDGYISGIDENLRKNAPNSNSEGRTSSRIP